MSLLESRSYYRPMEFEWAFEAFETQHKMHWLPAEVPLHDDVSDWNNVLNEGEKNLLTQLFRFFTQADIDIASAYIDVYMPWFKPPEVRMMLSAFAAMEGIHIQAYSLLLDTIGMPETEYKAFQEYEDMRAKHDYLESLEIENTYDLLKSLAVYSAFGEGLQLFSSFAMLLNFPRFGKMRGMGQIVSWSLRDEDLHVNSMIKLYHSLSREVYVSDRLEKEILQACEIMVDLEDKFIDLAYEQGDVEGLSRGEVKEYIKFTADKRLLQLGFDPIYKVKNNPLEWLDWMMAGVEHSNFFEARSTSYSKGSLTGSWQEVWEELDKSKK